ncbi:unnamed protein product [Pseudo-nitzschia multistriata]|uniref:Uncharacterized protein n=1 Tax=Pseudo-nitzschia multistriata TaxID=183589 RepID=A0A448ZPW4_9STRA|nr:unnamed protein product [Pseudo-nitzschia multistriata]
MNLSGFYLWKYRKINFRKTYSEEFWTMLLMDIRCIQVALSSGQHRWEEWRDNQGSTPKPERIPTTYFTPTENGGFLVSCPVPPTPEYPWDDPLYSPIAFVVQKISPDVFEDFNIFENQVKQDVKKNIILCVSLGVLGLVLILSILAVMSKILTQPLTWIAYVARNIINNDSRSSKTYGENYESGDRNHMLEVDMRRESVKKNPNMSSTSRMDYEGAIVNCNNDPVHTTSKGNQLILNLDLEADNSECNDDDEVGFVNFDYNPKADKRLCCTLSTELQQLLEAFQSMLHGFSGDGVSEVAEPGLCEIRNYLTWHSDFAKLYECNQEDISKTERKVSNSTRATTMGSTSNSSISISDASHYHIQDCEAITPCLSRNSQSESSSSSFPSKSLHEHLAPPSDIIRDIGSQQYIPEDGEKNEDSIVSSSSLDIYLPGPPPGAAQVVVPAPSKVNVTSNLGTPRLDPRPILEYRDGSFGRIKTACSSKFFWWIVVLMALPVFFTSCIIGSIVSSSILVTLPKRWKQSAKQGSNNIEISAMKLIVDRKAATMENLIEGPARDIYLLARTTNWLIFGGVRKSSNIVDVDSTSERCKTYPKGECPNAKLCSCDWEYGWNATGGQCESTEGFTDARYLQRQWFEAQKLDSNPITGERISSPSVPTSSESTLWWKNVTELPGSEIGPSRTSGYDTLYNRVAVSSASAVMNFPLHNFPSGIHTERTLFGGYLAFAVDGLLLGWSGCDDWHSSNAHFVSTYENGASLTDDKLCANGKHGYDPRCQDWYVQGRDRYLRDAVHAHVTSPYKLPLRNQVAQTITSPITNPRTGEYVGQVALDFRLDYEYVLKRLDDESSFTFMITPHDDVLGSNVVYFSESEEMFEPAKIEDLIFKNELNDVNRDYFKGEILPLIKAGERGNSEFFLAQEDGSEVLGNLVMRLNDLTTAWKMKSTKTSRTKSIFLLL